MSVLESSAKAEFGARIVAMAQELARFSESSDGLTCTYFSGAHKAVAAQLRSSMQAAGLAATVDPVGNVIGRYASADAKARTLIVGSHYDTVVDAGMYDGWLGVLTGLVVAEHLKGSGRRLPFHLEVIGFA